MAYPLDIDPNQDHLKISKHNYVRPDINQSKGSFDVNYKKAVPKGSSGVVKTNIDVTTNRAGDSVAPGS